MSTNKGSIWIGNFMRNQRNVNVNNNNNNVNNNNNNNQVPRRQTAPPRVQVQHQVQQRAGLNLQEQQQLNHDRGSLTDFIDPDGGPSKQKIENSVTMQFNDEQGPLVQGIGNDLTQAIQHHDDVRRKVILGKSKDEGYYREVEERVQNDLTAIQNDLANPSKINEDMLKKLMDLNNHLNQQKIHYSEVKKNESKEFKEQRSQKTEAIAMHQNRINEIANKVQQAIEARKAIELQQMQTEIEATKNIIAKVMHIQDNEEREQALTDTAKTLEKLTPTMHEAIFREVQDHESLALILPKMNTKEQDKAVQILVKTRVQDTEFMDKLSEQMIVNEIGALNATTREGRGAALRGNSITTKVTARYNKSTPTGKQFLDTAMQGTRQRLLSSKEDLDLDVMHMFPKVYKGKEKGDLDLLGRKERQQLQQRIDQHKELAKQMIDEMINVPVPPEMSKICATIYDEYMQKVQGEVGEDEAMQKATALVGGHVMLRLLSPQVYGDPETSLYVDPNVKEEQKPTLSMQTKILQGISNGLFDPSKEPVMQEFNDLIQTELPKMQKFFWGIVEQGRQAKQQGNQQGGNNNNQQGGNQPPNNNQQGGNQPPNNNQQGGNQPPNNNQQGGNQQGGNQPPNNQQGGNQPPPIPPRPPEVLIAQYIEKNMFGEAYREPLMKQLDPNLGILRAINNVKSDLQPPNKGTNGQNNVQLVNTARQLIGNVQDQTVRNAMLRYLTTLERNN